MAELCDAVRALLPHRSPGGARIHTAPPRAFYPPVWDGFQGFARPLWGMAALAASGEGARPGADVWDFWRDGLAHGTDPGHPEYWGPLEDRCQGFCEMPPVALSLLWAGGEMWDPLAPESKARVPAWLGAINRHTLPVSNWLWFRVLVNAVLRHLGGEADRGLVWGRSLCYRSCFSAFWSALAWAGLEALPWREIARLWRGQTEWWRRIQTTRPDGCLTPGFTYDNERVAESYIAHTSPYWQLKALLALRRPANHPFWSADETSTSAQTRPGVIELPTCGGLLCGSASNPLLLLVGQYAEDWLDVCGSRHGRFAYDCRFGFQLPTPGEGPSPDNALLVRPAAGDEPWLTRRSPLDWRVEAGEARVRWSPMPGVEVETHLRPCRGGHERVHHLESNLALECVEGGFPFPQPADVMLDNHRCALASTSRPDSVSSIEALDGRTASVFHPVPKSNLRFPGAVIPVLHAVLPAGRSVLHCRVGSHLRE